MQRLIYTSKAKPPADNQAILEGAQSRNETLGITGGLVIVDGVFLQYLEGPAAEVSWLFEKILQDERHYGVKVLECRPIPKRLFDDWKMGVLSWVDETKMIFRSFSPGHTLDLYETDPSTAAPLFRAWASTRHWNQALPTRAEMDRDSRLV